MRILLPIECDEFIKNQKGHQLRHIAETYNLFVQAKIDVTVDQFRSMFMLPPHKDTRGDASILDLDEEREGDKKSP